MAFELDNELQTDAEAPAPENAVAEEAQVSDAELALVKSIQKRIKADKDAHKAAFKQMRDDMYLARHGHRDTNAGRCGRAT